MADPQEGSYIGVWEAEVQTYLGPMRCVVYANHRTDTKILCTQCLNTPFLLLQNINTIYIVSTWKFNEFLLTLYCSFAIN